MPHPRPHRTCKPTWPSAVCPKTRTHMTFIPQELRGHTEVKAAVYRSGNPMPPLASSLTHPGTWGGMLWEAQKSPGVHILLIQLLVPSEIQFVNKIFFNDHCDFYMKNKGEYENQNIRHQNAPRKRKNKRGAGRISVLLESAPGQVSKPRAVAASRFCIFCHALGAPPRPAPRSFQVSPWWIWWRDTGMAPSPKSPARRAGPRAPGLGGAGRPGRPSVAGLSP